MIRGDAGHEVGSGSGDPSALEPDPFQPGRNRTVSLLSVSMDLGAGRRGVDMGPSALRVAELVARVKALGYQVEEAGTVHAAEPELSLRGESRARYLPEILEVCREARARVLGALERDRFPLILGGDHALSMGTASAVASHYRKRGQPVGLIWVDAHTDMNTPDTSPSGNIHGMPLAVLTGRGSPALLELVGGGGGDGPCFDPAHVSVIGARELDAQERRTVRESGIRVFTMTEVDERGPAACIEEALERACRGTAGVHVSFDLDSIDPSEAPGVGTPVAGGLSYREAHLICEKVAASRNLLGFELVELNPILDLGNRTAHLGVGLVESALGKRIL